LDQMKSTISFVLANNTFDHNTSGSYGKQIKYELENPLIAFNNIFYDTISTTSIIRLINSSAYFYNNIIDTEKIHGGSWIGDYNFIWDPLFIDSLGHISDSSPCIDMGTVSIEVNGTTYYCPEKDIDGGWRPQCGQADIGADELVCVWIKEQITNNEMIKVYPNPVESSAIIQYTIYSIQFTNLSVYDSFGRIVETLVSDTQKPGDYTVRFNAEGLPAGIYIYRLIAGKDVVSGKMIVR